MQSDIACFGNGHFRGSMETNETLETGGTHSDIGPSSLRRALKNQDKAKDHRKQNSMVKLQVC
jgi:hypothetical protein